MAYGISAFESNAMKSDNPNSGVYKAESSRTLDFNGGNPACNQGGMAIVSAVDVRNGAENECNGALQSRSANNIQSNNVVRQVLT